jgi:hypothetical protein
MIIIEKSIFQTTPKSKWLATAVEVKGLALRKGIRPSVLNMHLLLKSKEPVTSVS